MNTDSRRRSMKKCRIKRMGDVPESIYASPWGVVGAAILLALAVVVLAVVNIRRAETAMSELLREKGRGPDPGLRGRNPYRHHGALRPGGAHPDPGGGNRRAGRHPLHRGHGPERPGAGAQRPEPGGRPFSGTRPDAGTGPHPQGQVADHEGPGGRAGLCGLFHLYPDPGGGRSAHGQGAARNGTWSARRFRPWTGTRTRGRDPTRTADSSASTPARRAKACGACPPWTWSFSWGMDVRPFELSRAADVRNTMVISSILIVLGFGGVISLFWAEKARVSRKLLMDTRATASEVVANLPVGLIVTDREGRTAFFQFRGGRDVRNRRAGSHGPRSRGISARSGSGRSGSGA